MQTFFKRKYIKIPITSLLIVSLLLQFIPSFKPAKALDVKDILKKIFAIIQVPSELELTDEGGLKFGAWMNLDCLFKQQPEPSGNSIDLKFCGCQIRDGLKCGWRDNNDCRRKCSSCPASDQKCLADCCSNSPDCGGENSPCCLKSGQTCVNPFSTFRFGHHESQTDLVIKEGPEKGRLTIPNPKTPLRCQLKIPLPDEDDTSTAEEKLAERRACNSFRQVQQAAAQVAYTAKKIFNNTDPLSKCFFLRNCKTSCSFRFGSVTYIITLLDIVRLFVGDATVALNVVQKIINIVRIFQSLVELGDALKDLYDEGVNVVGSLLDTVKNIATLGSSLRELGVKISDAFVFTPVSIATRRTEERVGKAYNGFIDLINNFASNLEKYQSAKSEALALVEQTKEDVVKVMEESATVTLNPSSPDEDEIKVGITGFKNEPEIGFLFVKRKDPANPNNYEKKVKLDKILANYQTMFQPISSLIDQIASLGDMFDGKSFADLQEGTEDEWWEKSVEKYKEFCALDGGIWQGLSDEQGELCGFTRYNSYIHPEMLPGEGKSDESKEELMNLMENWMSDDIRINLSINRDRTTRTYLPDEPEELDLATQKIVLDQEFFEDFCTANSCWDQDEVSFCDDVRGCWQESGEFCRVYTFKGDRVAVWPAHYDIAKAGERLDADYIKGMLYKALSKDQGEDEVLTLDYNDGPWRNYWEELARLIKGDAWVDEQIDRWVTETTHSNVMGAIETSGTNLQIIKDLDGQGFRVRIYDQVWDNESGEYKTEVVGVALDGNKIDRAIEAYKAYTPPFNLGTVSETSPWFETFQQVFRGINGFRAAFRYLDPEYIRIEVIGPALGAYDCDANNDNCAKFAYERLADGSDIKDPWRWYWERLGRALLEQGRVDYILEHKEDKDGTALETMQDRHEHIMELVVAAMKGDDGQSMLSPISGLNGGSFDKDEGFNDDDDKIQKPLNEYKALFDGKGSFSMRYDKIVKIETIKHKIDILEQQNDDLQTWTDVPPNNYWKSKIWCTKNPEDIDAVEHYKDTFEGDVVDYDWQERIGLVVDTKDNLDTVKDALSYRLGPSQPVLVYYITRAQNKLTELAKDFGETIQTVLNGIQKEIDSFCGDIEKDPVYKTYRTLRDCYAHYQDGTKSCEGGTVPTCESWIGACGNCKQCVNNCGDKCNVDCTVDPGDTYYECECYDEDDGWEWEKNYDTKGGLDDPDGCKGANGCKQDCGSASWDCDKVTKPDKYDCPLPGGVQNYSDQSTCKENCKRSNCSSDADCEDNYCSAAPNNTSTEGGACWWRDDYERQYKEELNKLNAECARRKRYFDYLERPRAPLHTDFAPIIQTFQDNFEPLETALTNLQGVWKDPVVVDRESAIASSTVQKIIYTINESKKIIEEILPNLEDVFADLGVLEEARKYLNAGYCNNSDACTKELGDDYRCPVGVAHNNCEEVSESTWNKFLLNDPANPELSGIIVKIEKEIETAKRQVLNFIKMKAGTYSSATHPQLDQFGNISFPAGCPDENAGALFLNRIRCFEDENNRDFYQLPDFIKVIEGLEDVSFAMDDLKENIIDLEPSIDMEVVEGLKDKLDTIGENPITLLDGTFQAIRRIFSAISVPPLRTDISAFLNNAWRGLGDWNVFGRTASTDKNRRLAYRNAMENLEQENITDLIRLVFAEDDVNKGCQALSLVLNSNPRQTRENCLARSEDLLGTVIDDFHNANSQQGCRALGELDLTVFTEDAQQKQEELIAEKEKLEAQRACVRKITCNDPILNSCITCPEWICEGIDDPYCLTNADRKAGMAVWQTDPNKPGYVAPQDRAWPPRDPCKKGEPDYANSMAMGYTGSQTICIQTQKDVGLYKSMLGENSDFDWVTKELIAKCDELAIQKSLKKECEHFEMLEDNVFPDACGGLSNCSSDATDGFQAGRVVSPCKQYCDFIHKRAWDSFCKSPQQGIEPVLPCGNSVIPWRDDIPNLTLPTPGNKPEDQLTEGELEDLNELKAHRAAVIERCGLAAHNIQQPLDEVMKIFAILIGIKSATGLYSGVQILKSSTTKIINDVKDFVKIIKGTPCEDGSDCDCDGCEDGGACSGGIVKDIQCIWKKIDEGLGGGDQGLKVEALQCESHPAVSYSTTKGEKLTSNQGGPVCPGIDEFFQQIEGQFGVVRQNVQQIDLLRKGVKEGGFSIGRLNLHLWDEYPVIYHSFDDLYDVAEDIRNRTSYVWALANAVEFANKQCACGQSYCKMPLCVSGLPLAFAPVKNPYCYIVWLFRYPMLKVVEGAGGLEKLLEQQVK